MPTDRELLEARLKSAPWQLHLTVFSAVLGLLMAIRVVLVSVSAESFSSRTVIFGLIMFGFFATNGLGLIRSSKISYVVVTVFGLLPLLGSLAGVLELTVFTLGLKPSSPLETFISFLCSLQFLVIVTLLFALVPRRLAASFGMAVVVQPPPILKARQSKWLRRLRNDLWSAL